MDRAIERYVREDLGRVLKLLTDSNIRELDLRDGDLRVVIRRPEAKTRDDAEAAVVVTAGQEVSSLAPPLEDALTCLVRAPVVGTFYRAAQPDGPPCVTEGTTVAPTTVVGIIEALQVITEVVADCRGRVQRLLAADGEAVEYGQPLVEILRVD